MNRHDHHDDHGGLTRDLIATGGVMSRRKLLRIAASLGVGVGALQLLGCEDPKQSATTASNPPAGTPANASDCARVPEETEGPFPGDDVLGQTGVVRGDVRSSFAGLSGTADGIPLGLALTIVSAKTCEPLAGHAVYIWQCDREGLYSLYSNGATDRNYLRGVQEADANGRVAFQTIFPACYPGRWPHIHFEVFPSLAAATNAANRMATSQIALPKSACDRVYATRGYEQSIDTLSQISLETDGIFSDGAALELATISGDLTALTAALTVAV